MASIHRLPVLDQENDFERFEEKRNSYIRAAEEYGVSLKWYMEAVEKEKSGTGSEDIIILLDRLADSYENMHGELSRFNGFLDDFGLGMHESYVQLDEDGKEYFAESTGRTPENMSRESPEDFYFQTAKMLDHKGISWKVETRSIDDMQELYNEVQQSTGSLAVPVETQEMPDTSPEGDLIDPDVFSHLLEVYDSASDSQLYERVHPHERHVYAEYGASVLSKLWGIDMSPELLDQVDEGNHVSNLSD